MSNNKDFMDYLSWRGNTQNKYAAGIKRYGASGRIGPNIGKPDRVGYRKRDRKAQAKRDAMLKRMMAGQGKRYMSKDFLDPKSRSF